MSARHLPPWAVFLVLWLGLMLGPVRFSSRDNIPAQLLTESILAGHGFDLSAYHPGSLTADSKEVFWNRDRLVTRFPVIHAVLSLPLALGVGALEPALDPAERSRITGRAAGALFAAAALGVTYAVLLRLTTPLSSLAITLAAAFASPLYSVASRELWNHGPAALLLAAIAWLSFRTGRAAVFGSAACVAATYFVRHAALAPAAVLFLVLQRHAPAGAERRRLLWATLGGGAAASLPLALLSQVAMGHPLGGYASLQMFQYSWGLPRLEALLAYLISPARGLLVFAPLTLLAIFGLRWARCRSEAGLAWACLAAVVTAMIQIASYGPWWGGWAFGPRMLTEYVPLLAIMAAYCPPRTIVLGCALCVPAAGLHAAYVFKGGHSWDERRQIDRNPAAVWDLRDSPVTDLLLGPPRPALGMLDPRLALPVGLHEIDSDRPAPWLVYGWEPLESAGVWAAGNESWLAFSLPGPGRYVLDLSAAAPEVGGRAQRLEIRIGADEQRREHAFRSGLWDYESVRVDIPYQPGTIVVRIRPAHLWFPGHGDVRRCTFFVRSMSLERIED